MLESGLNVFGGEVVNQIAANSVYQSYLVSFAAAKKSKLIWVCPDQLFDDKQQQLFMEHAGWLASQSFPCIGLPSTRGEVEGQAACLYPFPVGEPLAQIMDRPFSVRQAVELIKQIASCLALPHSAACWHGNLSPETIYFDGDIPYLADFSLSQLVRLDYNSGIDPRFTSPEQVRGETPTAAADIYSLGCVFYHLLTGKPPFVGTEPFAIAKQHLEGEFPVFPEEMALLQPLIDAVTATKVEQRYNINQFIDALTALADQNVIDEIVVPLAVTEISAANEVTDTSTSLLDETVDSSELSARIEARLMEQSADFDEYRESEVPAEDIKAVTAILEQSSKSKKIGLGRFIVALLLGVTVGAGLYYFMNVQQVVNSSASTTAEEFDSMLVADLDHGISLWQAEDFNGAEAMFKRLIETYSGDPRAYNNLAAFYASQGNYEQARDYLELALAIDENYSTVYKNLSSIYAEMARGAYGRALQLGKTKELISLPIFSSNGINSINKIGDLVASVKKGPSKIAIKSDLIAENQPIAEVLTKKSEPEVDVATVEIEKVKTEAVTTTNIVEQPIVAAVEIPVVKEAALEPTSPAVTPVEETTAVADIATLSQYPEAEKFLHDWAKAWSGQDITAYLGCYADKFTPSGGKTRQGWEAQRRSRLANPKKIDIQLVDFEFVQRNDGSLQVELIQIYKSDVYSDRTKKSFVLAAEESNWEILRERSLGMIR